MTKAMLVMAVLMQSAVPSPELTVTPRAVTSGSDVLIVCRVPRHEDNRMVTFGIEGTRVSERDLDGDSPTIFRTTARVTCGDFEAFCAVTDRNRKVTRVKVPIAVGGCFAEDTVDARP